MNIKKVIVAGGGGHAKVLIDVLMQLPQFEVVGFLDDDENLTELLGVPRIGSLTVVAGSHETKMIVLGLGHVGSPVLLKRIVDLYTQHGFEFETVIAPTATVSKFAKIGKGVVVAAGAVIQPLAEIGDYCIVNTNASVDHDTRIGTFTHVAPGAAISGDVSIGHSCLLGTASSVKHGVTIADECIIGAGAAVVGHCLVNGIYVGVPAQLVEKDLK